MIPILTEYFIAMDQAGVAKQVGDIWQDELEGYPLWAVHNACRWWLSRKNTMRHKKPLPGDISDRCETEMMLVRLAERRVAFFDVNGPAAHRGSDEKVVLTDEQRAARSAELERLAGEIIKKVPRGQTAGQTQRNIDAARDLEKTLSGG